MSFNSRFVAVVFFSSFLLLGVAFGQNAGLQADVKGVDGRPSKSAEVRIERQDKKMPPVIVKTDRRGHLVATNLEAGTYKLTATVEGGIKSSQIVKTQANKPVLVAFDMTKNPAVTSKAPKKRVWVPAQTGSNIGGHWVDVDDQKGDSNRQNVDTINGNSLDNATRQSLGQIPRAAGGQ
jgi:hypothetical protein